MAAYLTSSVAFALTLATARLAAASTQFTEWTSVDLSSDSAVGAIGTAQVTFTGGNLTFADTAATFTGFSSSNFTPPLPTADFIEFLGGPGSPTYTITFDRPVQDVVLHLASLASRLAFHNLNPVKLSGEFSLNGNVVQGAQNDTPNGHDTNGTLLFPGFHTSLSFAAFFPSGNDGIALQIGATVLLPGDANLNGVIDRDDFTLTDRGLARNLTGWSNGDFNADNVVNAADMTILHQSYANQLGTPAATPVTIPEPATLSTLALIMTATCRRRRATPAR